MIDLKAQARRIAPATMIGGGLVLAGILLSGVSGWFLLISAAGALGPGILRELGWLHDHDEFQRQAAHRAGYHAYLVSALAAFGLVAFLRSGDRTLAQPQELATLFLALLWFTSFLSTLIGFWGARQAAMRILLCFGTAWLVFAIVSNVGAEWTGWTALLLHPLLAAPFFVLAWLSRRQPRWAGLLLIAVAGFLVYFLGLFRREHLALVNQAVTFVLFIGPLLASGLALLTADTALVEGDDEGQAAPPRLSTAS